MAIAVEDQWISRLSAGLDREERLARAAAEVDDEGESWQVRKVRHDGMFVWGAHQAIPPNGKGALVGLVDDAQTHHIEEQAPACTLRRVDAIRKLLAQRDQLAAEAEARDNAFTAATVDGIDMALFLLASIYVDLAEAGKEP